MSRGRAALVVAAGVGAALVVHFARGLPWALAGIIGLAVGILAQMSLRTWDQLRRIWGEPRE